MNTNTTYTLYMKIEADQKIIARGMSAVEAMRHIVELVPERDFIVTCENYQSFRRFDWSLSINLLSYAAPAFHATVPFTEDYDADKAAALELIGIQFLRIAHEYWDGWVDTDADFDERLQDDLRYSASLDESDRIQREIAGKFVDALTNGGYERVFDTIGNEFTLANPADREDLLTLFFDHYGITSYSAVKCGTHERFRIGNVESSLDIVQGLSEGACGIIEHIVAPYRQDPQIAAIVRDIVRGSPERACENDPESYDTELMHHTVRASSDTTRPYVTGKGSRSAKKTRSEFRQSRPLPPRGM